MPNDSADVLLALQNRINDLEAKIQASEAEKKGKNFLEAGALDLKISELRVEIGELLKQKADVKKEDPPNVTTTKSKREHEADYYAPELDPWR